MFLFHSRLIKWFNLSAIFSVILYNGAGAQNWKEIKPFRGEHFNVLFITPSQKILAGSMNGILYSSSDGSTWKALYNFSTQSFTWSIYDISSDPSGIIFVNTMSERGILRSTDDGASWSSCKPISTPVASVFSMACDNKGGLYAGRQDGVYLSKDKGENWTKILTPDYNWYFRIINFHNNNIYAVGDKLYISNDAGKTWSKKGLPTGATIQSLVHFSENEMMLMASFPDLPFVNPGIFHTTDGGTTWKQLIDGSALNSQSKLKLYNGKLYLTSYLGRVFVSSDRGLSWDLATSNQTAANISDIVFNNSLFLASSLGGGILKSEDAGIVWKLSNEGLPKIRNRALQRRDDGGLIVANNAGIYLFNTAAGGYTPLNYTNGSISEIVDMHIMADKSIIAANYLGGIVKSADNGNTWRLISTPWEVYALKLFTKGPDDNIYIYGGSPVGLYKYSNVQNRWTFVSSDFPYAGSICFNENTVYISSHQGIYTSSDSCKSWSQLFNFIDPVEKISILKSGYLMIFTSGGGIKYSTDSGKTWKVNNDAPLSGLYYNDAAALNDGRLLLATNRGLLESADQGASWKHNPVFEKMAISRIVKADLGKYIYLLTDNGIYELDNQSLSVNESPAVSEFRLRQNFPNPFNPITTISYTIPSASEVNLTVYDILGQKVVTLVDEKKSSGTFSVNFDGSILPSGTYVCTMRAGNFRESKKLLLLK